MKLYFWENFKLLILLMKNLSNENFESQDKYYFSHERNICLMKSKFIFARDTFDYCADLGIKIIAGNRVNIAFVSSWKKLIHRHSRINDWARSKVFHWIQFRDTDVLRFLSSACNDRFNATPVIKARNWWWSFQTCIAKLLRLRNYCSRQNNISFFVSLFFFLPLSRQINCSMIPI